MSVGVFTDKKHQPSEEEVRRAIGVMAVAYDELSGFIRENYPVEEDFKFMYGKNYGWARRFRIKGKLLTSLFPTEGGFAVQVNLSSEAVEQVLAGEPGKAVREAIERANPYPEGRWLFIQVRSPEEVAEIRELLALRVKTRRIR